MLLLKTEHFWSDKSFKFNAYRLPSSKYFSIIGVKPDENFTLCHSGIFGLQNWASRCSPNTTLVWDLVWGSQEMFWCLLFLRELYKGFRSLRSSKESSSSEVLYTCGLWVFKLFRVFPVTPSGFLSLPQCWCGIAGLETPAEGSTSGWGHTPVQPLLVAQLASPGCISRPKPVPVLGRCIS